MNEVLFSDLGNMDYKLCWDLQTHFFNRAVEAKFHNRQHPDQPAIPTIDRLFFVEHPHVYTLGKSGDVANLLLKEDQLQAIGVTYYPINRGGDITYHGPGQIVGYPIFDLDHFFSDIHKYLRYIEESIILTLAEYGITASRLEGLTGVWIDPHDPKKARKIAALGVKCSRWVTMHGFAFNVNTQMDYFKHIIPCGIDDKDVTSMERELGRKLDFVEVKQNLKRNLERVFEIRLKEDLSVLNRLHELVP